MNMKYFDYNYPMNLKIKELARLYREANYINEFYDEVFVYSKPYVDELGYLHLFGRVSEDELKD
jgi:hypothetical protein